jgi:murein DD-endopeptidase MepM/ murein hydrolase activator NlpD
VGVKISPVAILVGVVASSILVAPLGIGIAVGVFASGSCSVQAQEEILFPEDGAAENYLSQFSAAEQTEKLQFVDLIVQIGLQRRFSVHSIEIAVATAIQESNLTNLGDLGEANDQDSLGLFQQRPSQGWGTAAEILNPPYAINAFYDRLETIPDRDERALIEVAIEVQISDRDAYEARWAWDQVAAELVARIATPETVTQCVHAGWQLPLDAGVYQIEDHFGMRYHPIYHRWMLHSGIDLSAPEWTPIYAAQSGTIDIAGRFGDLGNFVRINHSGGLQTGYGHMVEVAEGLERGDSVHAGQVIGYVGTTGGSTGYHLHFMIYVDGRVTNPVPFLAEIGLAF